MDSKSEAGPLVLLEAMASGCVPVVTAFGMVPEIVQSAQHGMICEDSAELVRVALSVEPQAVLEMSAEATHTGAQRSWGAAAAEYALLYREAASEGNFGHER